MSPKGRVRYMRLLVFFDLPVSTAAQRKKVLAVQEVFG